MDGADGTALGALLRQQRLAAGLSQEELADRSGLSVRTISKIERGETRRPYRPSVQALADALVLPSAQREQLMRLSRGVTGHAGGSTQPEDAPPVVRHALPPDVLAFSGRTAELSIIAAALPGHGQAEAHSGIAIRAIGGMPGVGKTTLAVHAAHLLAARFPDRQLFVDLHGHTPGRDPLAPGEALAGLLAATGVSARDVPADLAGRTSLWRDKLAGQCALLVFDNAASSEQVAPLLPGSGCCLVLVTSRRHLADLPAAVIQVPVEALRPDAAWDMFARLAPRAAGDQDAIAELVSLAGGLPLAISLLARVCARHPTWTLADLAAETRRDVLTLTAEHASVAAAFGLSWRQLEARGQKFLACLGLHPGASIDAYGAAALAGADLAEAAALLDGLHGEGLLTETSYRRYGMHDLIRRFAADRAAQIMTAAERMAAVGRLADYLQYTAGLANAQLRLLDRGALVQPPPALAAVPALDTTDKALAWVRAERPVLLALLDRATAAGERRRVVALTAALAVVLENDGPWTDAVARHTAAASAASTVSDQRGLAGVSLELGAVQRLAGEWAIAGRHLDLALNMYQDLGDQAGQAAALRYLADVRRFTGDYPAAADCLRRALALRRDLGDRAGQGRVLAALGDVLRMTGDFPGALPVLRQALSVCTQTGDEVGKSDALLYLAMLQADTGDYQAAGEAIDQSAAIAIAHGRPIDLANVAAVRGILMEATGAFDDAERTWTDALERFTGIGQRLGRATSLRGLGRSRLAAGDIAGATVLINQSLELYRAVHSRHGVAWSLVALSRVNLQTRDYLAAGQNLGAALASFRQAGNRAEEAETLNLLGTLHRCLGDLASSQECHHQALNLARPMTMRPAEAAALAGLGRCAIAAGDGAGGTAQLDQAAGILTRIGHSEAAVVGAELAALAAEPACSADD